jgi:Domain of unknown function (DUF6457)
MTTLDSWIALVCADLGVDPATVDVRQILDLARDAAHAVERPAAPLTAYLLGLAVGTGMPADVVATRLRELAQSWQPPPA